MRATAGLVVFVIAACSGSSSGGSSPPCSKYELCTFNGSGYDCDCGGGSWPACPASAVPDEPCGTASKNGCMGCSMGATYTCTCMSAGPLPDGGLRWQCVGGGQACQ